MNSSSVHHLDHAPVGPPSQGPGQNSLNLSYTSEQTLATFHDRHPLTPPHEPSLPDRPPLRRPSTDEASSSDAHAMHDPVHSHHSHLQQESDHIQIAARQYRQLQAAARHTKQSCDDIAILLNEAMRVREQNSYDRHECMEKHGFLLDSQSSLLRHLLRPPFCRPVPVIMDLCERKRRAIESDYGVLKSYDHVARTSDNTVLQADYDLLVAENVLAASLTTLLNILQLSSLSTPDGTFGDHEQPQAPIEPTLHEHPPMPDVPLELELYYEKAGAVGWRTDRIYELEHEYQDARTSRSFRQDQGEELDISDADFEADYRQRLSGADEARRLAVHEASQARQVCLNLGIDPDTRRSIVLDRMEHDGADLTSHMDSQTTGQPHAEAPLPANLAVSPEARTHQVEEWVANTGMDSTYPLHLDWVEQFPEPDSPLSRPCSTYDLPEEPAVPEPAVGEPPIRDHVPEHVAIPPEPARIMLQPLYGSHSQSWAHQLRRRMSSDPGMRRTFVCSGLDQDIPSMGPAQLRGSRSKGLTSAPS